MRTGTTERGWLVFQLNSCPPEATNGGEIFSSPFVLVPRPAAGVLAVTPFGAISYSSVAIRSQARTTPSEPPSEGNLQARRKKVKKFPENCGRIPGSLRSPWCATDGNKPHRTTQRLANVDVTATPCVAATSRRGRKRGGFDSHREAAHRDVTPGALGVSSDGESWRVSSEGSGGFHQGQVSTTRER